MKIYFKFKKNSTAQVRREIIEKLINLGVSDIQRLFPDEADKNLTSIYVAEKLNATFAEKIIKLLNFSKFIDFAEKEIKRKLPF